MHFPDTGGLRKVVWRDPQTDGHGDRPRKRHHWVTWCSFWYSLEYVGLQNVAWSDPQAERCGDKRRIPRPWDV